MLGIVEPVYLRRARYRVSAVHRVWEFFHPGRRVVGCCVFPASVSRYIACSKELRYIHVNRLLRC